MTQEVSDTREWLEADGLGGFASGTASLVRTRRYHALLLASRTPPSERFVLVNGVDARVRTPAGEFYLVSQRYAPGVRTSGARIASFTIEPWPTWVFELPDGTRVTHEVCVEKGAPRCVLRWSLEHPAAGVSLVVRPLLSGRDFHALHHENAAFRFEPVALEEAELRWTPYDGVPATRIRHNGRYAHDPAWYRGFEYDQERARGLDCLEDLASPGEFSFDLSRGAADMVLLGETLGSEPSERAPEEILRSEGERRAAFPSRLERSADAYIVSRGEGNTIIAGYPWFGDWGRDTFIAMRGLCLATERLGDARVMLLEWSRAVCAGMLPNRFPDRGESPEYNSVDAALWFVVSACEFLSACEAGSAGLAEEEKLRIVSAVNAILAGYSGGTAYGIGMDADGLLRAGVPGVQLTWMDAKVGSWVVTPRHGKPVEVQALWINALRLASELDSKWREPAKRALKSLRERFWNAEGGCLHDVVDGPGGIDSSLRPNQILAVGGLPFGLLRADQARSVVDTVERRLWTPMGPRTLAPGSPGYRERYEGDVWSRDGAYHQGTAWPWLIGAFVEAWVRVRGGTPEAKLEARRRFVEPILAHLGEAGLGHVSEIADAEGPHTPRGCPFQAWSIAELLRLERVVLATPSTDLTEGERATRAKASTRSGRSPRLATPVAKGPTVP